MTENVLERISPDITRQWLHGRRIVVFNIVAHRLSKSLVDLYAASVIETMLTWPQDQPYLCLQRFTDSKDLTSAYLKKRTHDISEAVPSAYGRVASVIPDQSLADQAQLWLQHEILPKQPSLQHLVFYNRRAAFDWLLAHEAEALKLSYS